jgi:hypothetical protein
VDKNVEMRFFGMLPNEDAQKFGWGFTLSNPSLCCDLLLANKILSGKIDFSIDYIQEPILRFLNLHLHTTPAL